MRSFRGSCECWPCVGEIRAERANQAGSRPRSAARRTTSACQACSGQPRRPRVRCTRCSQSTTSSGSWPRRTSALPSTAPVRPRPPWQCTTTPSPARPPVGHERRRPRRCGPRRVRGRAAGGARSGRRAWSACDVERARVVLRRVAREVDHVAEPALGERVPRAAARVGHARRAAWGRCTPTTGRPAPTACRRSPGRAPGGSSRGDGSVTRARR